MSLIARESHGNACTKECLHHVEETLRPALSGLVHMYADVFEDSFFHHLANNMSEKNIPYTPTAFQNDLVHMPPHVRAVR